MPGLTITYSDDVAAAAPGGVVTYTITIANTGGLTYTGLTVTESLADIVDDAASNGDATRDRRPGQHRRRAVDVSA